jgi:spermidine synthase
VKGQQNDLAPLLQRLNALKHLPDGVLQDEITPLHHIRIIKDAGQIQFYFVDPVSGALDGPMSRIEIDRPLRLLASYTQSAMLTLLWNPVPTCVCLLGMAGGRLSLLFHHYFADIVVDNVDIDPAVAAIATNYFGITFDDRQRIAIQDARAFLNDVPETPLPSTQVDDQPQAPQARLQPARYEIIVMDAFRDASDDLNHLATRQFYQVCKQRLAPSGVLCVNILKSDRLFFEKIKTIMSSFRHVLIADHKRSLVLFGNDRRQLTRDQIVASAALLQRQHTFDFPFEERAAALQSARTIAVYSGQKWREVRVLEDGDTSSG